MKINEKKADEIMQDLNNGEHLETIREALEQYFEDSEDNKKDDNVIVEESFDKCDLKKTIKAIGGLIEQREDFIHSTNMNIENESFLHTYNIVEQGQNLLLIMAEYDDGTSNGRQFLVYDVEKGILRDATEKEDDHYRNIDDEDPYREKDSCVFVIGRMPDNTISYGDGLK